MILHPGILALLGGSLIVVVMLLYSSYLGIRILRRWDINSSSEEQLSLERRTYLLSTMMSFVLAFEVLSIFLFIYTADDLHRQFVGAMCATGSLNANPAGWYVLYLGILIFFLSSLWIGINYIDQRTEGFPFVRFKYGFLLVITPVLIVKTYLQAKYFLGLNPNIITSCCGALFSGEGRGLSSSLSSLPIRPMQYIFFSVVGIFIIMALVSIKTKRTRLWYITGVMSLVVFIISIASIVSFISLYFYEIPTHHCPFDMLQGYYNYIGYPLYGSLFSGTVLAMLASTAEILKKKAPSNSNIERYQKKWTLVSVLFIIVFVSIVLYPMVFSTFTLEGY